MFTACVCIGDCLIFKHIMKRNLLCMDFYLVKRYKNIRITNKIRGTVLQVQHETQQ